MTSTAVTRTSLGRRIRARLPTDPAFATSTAPPPSLDWRRLLLLTACLVVAVLFWHQPFLWPLKMLVVLMHESGHALATVLAGGEVVKLTVAADQSGRCLSMLPQGFFGKVLVYSAGYVGSAIVGATLLVLTFPFALRRVIPIAFAVWLGALALFYSGDFFTTLFCVVCAALFGVAARFLPEGAIEVMNLFLAGFSVLYVAADLRDDLWLGGARSQTDAGLLAELTPIPALVWVALWTLFSIVILVVAIAWCVRARSAQVRGRIRNATNSLSS